MKAKVLGRDAVMRRLRALVPEAEKQLAIAQLEGAQELAARIKPRAPGPRTEKYQASIQGDRLANRPKERAVGKGLTGQTKDPNATGVFAEFIWRFLEFGTKPFISGGMFAGAQNPGIVAQPHIFPTYRAYRKKLRRKMAAAVNKAVRAVRKK
jgi:hypothetical protein